MIIFPIYFIQIMSRCGIHTVLIIVFRIERMQQVGLIRKWMSEYQPKRDKCWKSKQTDVANHTVNMDDMQGSFIVLLLG